MGTLTKTVRPQSNNTGRPLSIEEQIARAKATAARIERELAARGAASVIQGMGRAPNDAPRVSGGRNSYDQVLAAYERLMGIPGRESVHKFDGIREFYQALTGDRNLSGVYQPENALIKLAYNPNGNNADSTAMAEMTRNVMAKRLVEEMILLSEYEWWRRICRLTNFETLQLVSWVRVHGIGDLPTVAEKAEYSQLAWDDSRVAADWVKKGGYLPLSLEMIDRDDLVGWRDVPRQLAYAAVVTISNVISAFFTDNAGLGPVVTIEGTTGEVFGGAGFANLLEQPLTLDNYNWAVEKMYALPQAGVAGRRQGARPTFALVPIEQEGPAVENMTSRVKPGTYANKLALKRVLPEDNVITVPQWTNANDWAVVSDPALVAFASVGFRFGEQPELFTMADAGTDLLFTNDVLPIKVRYFFAAAITDPRGAIKSNSG